MASRGIHQQSGVGEGGTAGLLTELDCVQSRDFTPEKLHDQSGHRVADIAIGKSNSRSVVTCCFLDAGRHTRRRPAHELVSCVIDRRETECIHGLLWPAPVSRARFHLPTTLTQGDGWLASIAVYHLFGTFVRCVYHLASIHEDPKSVRASAAPCASLPAMCNRSSPLYYNTSDEQHD